MNAGRIPVLMYHRVGQAHNAWEQKYCVSPERFAEQMRALARKGHNAVTTADFLDWLDGRKTLPEGAIVITFDDGFRGVYEHAFPVLAAQGWPATVFLVVDLIGEVDAWSRTSNPDKTTYPLMGLEEIQAMAAGNISFHSHSRNHPSLPTLEIERLGHEISGSRERLRELLGTSVEYFAYPYGHFDERVRDVVIRAGYRAAFSTQPGFNRRDVDRYRIRRLDVFGTDTPAMLLRKLRYGSNDGNPGQVVRYYWRQVTSRLREAS